MLLPGGKRDGREYVAGDTAGGDGKSLKVTIAGDFAGQWKDWATGEGGDLVDLWAAARRVSIADALRQAREFLGIAAPAFAGSAQRSYRRPEKPKATRPKGAVLEYLHGRGLTDATIAAYKVAANDTDDEIIFPFLRGGELVNCKYLKLERPLGKKQVRQEKDAEPCLFGWQAIPDLARSVVVCEGEIDAMTWWQMGFPALSVWSGAGNLQWVENEWDRLARFDRIYLAFDADDAGQAGAAAAVERLGRARCRIVTTPYKDANECVAKGLDRECFRDIIDAAASLDPKELRNAAQYVNAVLARFFPPEGSRRGFETPFEKLQGKVLLRPAELVIVNGINGHGKTKLLSQIALAIMGQDGRCCMASMEVKADALLESMTIQACAIREPSKPFILQVQDYWNDRLWLFDAIGTVKAEYLIDVFRYARQRYGITCFFIDSLAKCGIAEDDYNGQKRFVEALCDFKNETDSTVFLVTHSRKLEAETRIVDKMDIKGTGAIADLADSVTTLWRNKPKEAKPEEKADEPDAYWCWQKNRNGDWEGNAALWYDAATYQYRARSDDNSRAYVRFVRPIETHQGAA
jgi:twinkle protein